MSAIVFAILPIFLVIFLGAVLRAWRFPPGAFWDPAERLVFFLLLPALLIRTLAGADLSGLGAETMAGAIALALLAMTLILLAVKPLIAADGPAFTSLFQGATRMNTYIGLAVSVAVYGDTGLAAAAVAVAVIVPLANLLGIVMLAHFGRGARASLAGAAGTVIRNPLILACLLGIALNLSGAGLPPVIDPFLDVLSRAALPLALLSVGAGLDLGAARAGGRAVAAAVGLKLLVLPLITAAVCRMLDVAAVAAFVAILFNGLPTSPVSYVLARQMGGDAKLMAGIITVQTALAIATLPVVLGLLASP